MPAVWARSRTWSSSAAKARGWSRSTASVTSTTRRASASRTPATPTHASPRRSPSRRPSSSTASRTSSTTSPACELHERLPRYFPGVTTGSRALPVELGRRGDRGGGQAGQDRHARPSIVAFRGGFHGRTHAGDGTDQQRGVKSAATTSHCRAGVHHVALPRSARVGGGGADRPSVQLDVTMRADRGAVRDDGLPRRRGRVPRRADPRRGRLRRPADGFLPALREIADRHGILLIADEVQTGYGRTGRFFASEWTGAGPTSSSWPRASRRACRCPGSWRAGR